MLYFEMEQSGLFICTHSPSKHILCSKVSLVMKTMHQIDRVKIKLRLAKNTDSFLEVFGASSHKYYLGSPLFLEDVNAFEQKYNIQLPIEYKNFLTKIGNGGIEYNSVNGNSAAGPDYGIFNLGHKFHFLTDASLDLLKKEPFIHSHITEDEWGKIFGKIDENISDEELDRLFAKAYAGVLTIGHSGCSGYIGLMITGDNKGRILYMYEEIEYCPKFATELNFLDWYENWLDKIICGQSLKTTNFSQTENQCLERFYQAEDPYWKQVSLSYIKAFDNISNEAYQRLWHSYMKEGEIKIKHYLLNLLVKFNYEKAKPELEKLSHTHPLEFLKILHLYAPEKTHEWVSQCDVLEKCQEVIEYIKYITVRLDLN